jgi:hypothetical protein
MTAYTSLKSSETRLEGQWGFREDGCLIPDETCSRIEYLTQNVLKKLATDITGWQILYQDPVDYRYWELTYPHSDWQGGGPPLLQHIDIETANVRYTHKKS